MEASLVKSGELCLRVTLSRCDVGIQVNVKASPLIEAYMKGLGNGEATPVAALGKNWTKVKEDGPELAIWDASRSALSSLQDNQAKFALNYPGRDLSLAGEIAPNCVNLTFLRLVGISEKDGVTFNIKGIVYSLDGLRTIKNAIGQAGRELYVNYIRPVDMTTYVTQVSSQEMQY